MNIFLHNLTLWIESSKYILLFFGAIVEGPVLMLASGFLYHLGQFSFVPMYLALVAGDFTADIGWYCLGRFATQRFIFKYSHIFSVTEETLKKIERLFGKYHQKILIISKLTMGFGFAHIILMVAGIFKVPFKNYVILNGLGGFIWTGFLVTVGYFVGNIYASVPESMKIAFIAIAILIFIFGLKYLNNYLQKQEL